MACFRDAVCSVEPPLGLTSPCPCWNSAWNAPKLSRGKPFSWWGPRQSSATGRLGKAHGFLGSPSYTNRSSQTTISFISLWIEWIARNLDVFLRFVFSLEAFSARPLKRLSQCGRLLKCPWRPAAPLHLSTWIGTGWDQTDQTSDILKHLVALWFCQGMTYTTRSIQRFLCWGVQNRRGEWGGPRLPRVGGGLKQDDGAAWWWPWYGCACRLPQEGQVTYQTHVWWRSWRFRSCKKRYSVNIACKLGWILMPSDACFFLSVLGQSENHEGGSFGHHCAAGSSNEASPGQVAALSEKNWQFRAKAQVCGIKNIQCQGDTLRRCHPTSVYFWVLFFALPGSGGS